MKNNGEKLKHERHSSFTLGSAAIDNVIDNAATASAHEIQMNKRRLWIALAISSVFFLAELLGGYFSRSLALFSDAFHLLSDMAGFAISLAALYLAQQPATKRHSFGFHRAEILGAILSILLIWVLTGVLVVEAVNRLKHPETIDGKLMTIVAAFGVAINIILGVALGHGHGHDHGHGHGHGRDHGHDHDHDHKHDHGHDHGSHRHKHRHPPIDEEAGVTSRDCENEEEQSLLEDQRPSKHRRAKRMNINVHSAFIHVIGDLISSVGVLISSIWIWYDPSKSWIDPACTFVFSVIVLITTLRLLYSSVTVLMEATPSEIDTSQLTHDLLQISRVREVHDLHVWALTVSKVSMAVHLSVDDQDPDTHLEITLSDYLAVLEEAQKLVAERYGIRHSTIQVEVVNSHRDANVASLTSKNPKLASGSSADVERGDSLRNDKNSTDSTSAPYNKNRYHFICRPERCNSMSKQGL